MAATSQGLALRPRLKWVQQDDDDWEAMYPHIQRLYIEQGRRLDDVISAMEREHDFRATKSRYKKRLTRWGFRKYGKKDASCTAAASRLGNPRGPKHRPKHPAQAHRQTSKAESAPSPLDVCRIVVAPDQEKMGFLMGVRDWNTAYFEDVRAARTAVAANLSPLLSPLQFYTDSQFVHSAFQLIPELLDRGFGQLAGRLARKAFIRAQDFLRLNNPWLLLNLTEVMHTIAAGRQAPLYDLFLKYVTGLVSQRYPDRHPLVQMLQSLRRVETKDQGLCSLLERGCYAGADSLRTCVDVEQEEGVLGILWDSCTINRPGPVVSITLHGVLGALPVSEAATIDSVELIRALWTDMFARIRAQKQDGQDGQDGQDEQGREISDQALLIQADHSGSVMALRAVSTFRRYARLLDNDPEVVSTEAIQFFDQTTAYAMHLLARQEEAAGLLTVAAERLQHAIHLRERGMGLASPGTVLDMLYLERLLRAGGREAAALRVQKDAIARLTGLLEDIPADRA